MTRVAAPEKADKTFVRDWWLEGLLEGTDIWHPLYGPLPEHEVKRLRNYFLDVELEKLVAVDAGLANYEDFRARQHEGPTSTSAFRTAKAIVRVAAIDPLVATSPMPRSSAAKDRKVAHPIRSSSTKIRIKVRKS